MSRRSSSRRSATLCSPASQTRRLRRRCSGSRRPRVSAISSCASARGISRRQRSPAIRPGFAPPHSLDVAADQERRATDVRRRGFATPILRHRKQGGIDAPGSWINDLPTAFFMVVHIAAFALGAGFAWLAFKRELALLGTAFSFFAAAELTYMTYHLDSTVFLFAHTIAECVRPGRVRARLCGRCLAGRRRSAARLVSCEPRDCSRLPLASLSPRPSSGRGGLRRARRCGDARWRRPRCHDGEELPLRRRRRSRSRPARASPGRTRTTSRTRSRSTAGRPQGRSRRSVSDQLDKPGTYRHCPHAAQPGHGRRGDRQGDPRARTGDVVILACARSAPASTALLTLRSTSTGGAVGGRIGFAGRDGDPGSRRSPPN